MPNRLRIRTPMIVVSVVSLATACVDQPLAPHTSSAAFSVSPQVSQGQASSGVEVYPWEGLIEVPCARDGQGDLIQLSAEVVWRWHFVRLPSGGFVGGDIAVVSHGTAVSLIDGTVYRTPLVNRVTDNWVADGQVGSNIVRSRFVGAGPGNDMTFESTSVWNFGPDGMRVWFSTLTATCGTDGDNVPGSNDGVDPIHDWPTE